MVQLTDMGKKVTRLYEQFQPENYDLEIELDRAGMSFSGRVIIRGKKTGFPSQRLTFHQKDLKITSAKVVKHDKKGELEIPVSRVNLQKSFDEMRLHSDQMIYPGQYTVTLEFKGDITRPMNGIYPSFFTHEGKDKQLLATQFESHHAREAFPCIDEPEAKATFDLTLVSPAGETVIGNTPIKAQKTSGKDVTTTFETTPRMSTYLLAFIVGELEYTEATTKNGTVVRCYATADHVKHTQFALDVAVKTLEFYNDYFDIEYPLEKCDFIALPDFASGAMENWGAITFREQALLVDPKNTSLNLKQYVANVVAHELTHQWFGNLVTMRWWTDLWLNESFASWMSYLAVDHLFPDWQVWTQFIVDEQGLALKQDALENTHPIEVEVRHPDEIRTIFDVISYEKGASMLLMLHHYLGAEAFRDGLRVYLKRHAYGNAITTDLWAALEEVSKRTVREFMGTWTSQSGFPIVHADVDKKLKLKQERFYINPSAKKEAASWPIPLLAQPALKEERLDKAEAVFDLPKDSVQLLLNHDRTGFYLTVYDEKHTERLAKAISTGKVVPLDRLGLLSDAFDAAKAGYAPTTQVLPLLAAYEHEDSAVVWDIITANLGAIRHVMESEELRDAMKPYIRKLVGKQLARLGWEEKASDSHFDRLLRPVILGLASVAEEKAVVDEALKRFEAAKSSEDIHPDLRGVIYGTASREGGKAEFEKLLSFHNGSKNAEERVTISAALTNFEQPELIQRALGLITSDDVRLQDTPYWIGYSFLNRHAKVATWKWLTEHWDWLVKNLGNDLSFFRMPIYSGRAFSDTSFLPEFTKFFEEHLSPGFERPLKQAIETIQWQAAWKERDLAALKKYFKT